MSSLNIPEATSSIPYSQYQYTSSVHSLNNNIIDSNTSANKKQGNQLVQSLKEIIGCKSTYDVGTEFSVDSTRSLRRLTGNIARIHEGNISLLSTSDDHDRRRSEDPLLIRRSSRQKIRRSKDPQGRRSS